MLVRCDRKQHPKVRLNAAKAILDRAGLLPTSERARQRHTSFRSALNFPGCVESSDSDAPGWRCGGTGGPLP